MINNSIEVNFEDKNKSISSFLAILLMIYLSNSCYAVNYLSAFFRIGLLIGTCILLILITRKRTIVLKKKAMIITFILMFCQLFTCIFNGYDSNELFLIFSILTAFLFTSYFGLTTFINSCKNIIYYISLISIIFYCIGYFFPSIFSIIPDFLLKNTDLHDTYIFLGTFVLQQKFSYTYYRNFGIFSEPGQFQIFLGFSLILELFFSKKINYRHIFILILTIISCNSTNGFIVAILVIVSYFFSKHKFNTKKNNKILLMLFVIFISIIVCLQNKQMITEAIEKITSLITGFSGANESGLERKRAIILAFNAYIKNPIVGLGCAGMKIFNPHNYIMTFSPLDWFAWYGTLFGLLANFYYLKFFSKKSNNLFGNLILILASFLLISGQKVIADVFIWIIIYYGIQTSYLDIQKRGDADESFN